MLKYDHQLTEVKSRLPVASRNLIVLSQNLNTDNLAASLSLYLSLKSAGKKVDIVSTGTPLVSHTNLYGVGELKNDIPKSGGGNFIISLDGVVDNTGSMQQIPALEKLDWYPEGSKLNLVFHVVKGQRFEPTNITSRHEETGYDLTWVIGCQSLNELGNLFISNSQYFAQSQVINIDINPLNAYFGFANVIDPQASSISEIVAQVLPSLTLSMDRDIASNIITGIYGATNNLTQKINPDTFMVVSQSVQVGGTLPSAPGQAAVASQPVSDAKIDYQEQPEVSPQSAPAPQPQAEATAPIPQSPQFPEPPQPQPIVSDISVAPPQPSLAGSPFIVPPQDINIPMPTYQPEPQLVQPSQPSEPQFQFSNPPIQSDNQAQPFDSAQGKPVSAIPQANAGGFDLRQIFQIPQMPSSAQVANPTPSGTGQLPQSVNNQSTQPEIVPQDQQSDAAKVSAEERPMGEQAYSPSPEMESTPTPDWLVPKIFKGGNLG